MTLYATLYHMNLPRSQGVSPLLAITRQLSDPRLLNALYMHATVNTKKIGTWQALWSVTMIPPA